MIFRNFPEALLGSKAKVKIILFLLSGGGPISERELARRLGFSHVAIGRSLRELRSTSLVRSLRMGNVNVWSLNESSYARKALNLEHLAMYPPLLDIKRNLESDFGEAPIKRVVLFGSIPEGREAEDSDIDLFLLVGSEKEKKQALEHVFKIAYKYKERYGNPLSPHILTERESKSPGNRRLMENVNRGIVIR